MCNWLLLFMHGLQYFVREFLFLHCSLSVYNVVYCVVIAGEHTLFCYANKTIIINWFRLCLCLVNYIAASYELNDTEIHATLYA